jgi:hypothetical protein
MAQNIRFQATIAGPNGGSVQQWMSIDNDYQLIDNRPETYQLQFYAYMVAAARGIASDRWD